MNSTFALPLGYAKPTPDVVSLVDKAVEDLVCLGAHVEEINPGLDDRIEIMRTLWSVGLALGAASMTTDHRAVIDPPLLNLAEPGFRLTALDYRRPEQARENFGRRIAMLHAKYDLLVTPQMPIAAFAAGHEVPLESRMQRWWEWSPFTYPFNPTQQPVAAVPCGFTTSGLPVSMQIVGAKYSDPLVLRAVRARDSSSLCGTFGAQTGTENFIITRRHEPGGLADTAICHYFREVILSEVTKAISFGGCFRDFKARGRLADERARPTSRFAAPGYSNR
jgi:Asp-tRNA(Asn)/Glu-tRNA(Gln) amidotransferase A subunit family amidase